MKLDLSKIPEYMHAGIQGYVDHGWELGSFLGAILSNDLVSAAENADDINKAYLFEYAQFMYCELPRACWGDRETIKEWIKSGGMDQYKKVGE